MTYRWWIDIWKDAHAANHRETHIKTTMRYHLTPVRMAIINTSTMLVKMQRKGNPCALLVVMEGSLELPQKIKNETAFWPSDTTFWNLPKEIQDTNSREYMHLYVHCSVIYNTQDIEAAQVSFNRWVDKTNMGHLHNGILLGHKKEKKFYPLRQHGWTWEHYAKWNKPVREKTSAIWFDS